MRGPGAQGQLAGGLDPVTSEPFDPDIVAARLYQSWKRKTAGMDEFDALRVFSVFAGMVAEGIDITNDSAEAG